MKIRTTCKDKLITDVTAKITVTLNKKKFRGYASYSDSNGLDFTLKPEKAFGKIYDELTERQQQRLEDSIADELLS